MRLLARLIDRLTDSLMAPTSWEFRSESYPPDARWGGEAASRTPMPDASNRPSVARFPRSST